MGFGPIVAALGFLLLARLDASVNYWTDVFPAVVIFGIGLSITVAPLTAAILGDVQPSQAGIASAVNNAVARVAGLIAVAAVGAVVAAQFSNVLDQRHLIGPPPSVIAQAKQAPLQTTPPKPYEHDLVIHRALSRASVSAFHTGVVTISGLMILGGGVSLAGIRNPQKVKQ
jgi:hypothetical protein